MKTYNLSAFLAIRVLHLSTQLALSLMTTLKSAEMERGLQKKYKLSMEKIIVKKSEMKRKKVKKRRKSSIMRFREGFRR